MFKKVPMEYSLNIVYPEKVILVRKKELNLYVAFPVYAISYQCPINIMDQLTVRDALSRYHKSRLITFD